MRKLQTFAAATLLAAGATLAVAAAGTAPATPAPAAAAAPAPAPAADAKPRPDHHCRNEANEKHLKGAARASFIKKCRADTPAK